MEREAKAAELASSQAKQQATLALVQAQAAQVQAERAANELLEAESAEQAARDAAKAKKERAKQRKKVPLHLAAGCPASDEPADKFLVRRPARLSSRQTLLPRRSHWCQALPLQPLQKHQQQRPTRRQKLSPRQSHQISRPNQLRAAHSLQSLRQLQPFRLCYSAGARADVLQVLYMVKLVVLPG